MKLFGKTKKLIDEMSEKKMEKNGESRENGENIHSLQAVEVVLVQYNLVDNQYRQKTEVLYTFTPNKSYAYLLDVEPSNLVFLKTYNTEFGEIITTFTDQITRPSKTAEKVNLTLLITKQKWDAVQA